FAGQAVLHGVALPASLFLRPSSLPRNRPPPAIYTLSLHDALPIYTSSTRITWWRRRPAPGLKWEYWYHEKARLSASRDGLFYWKDRKSTRLNSSHDQISYAVFCLKKKNDHLLRRVFNSIARLLAPA